MHHSEIRTAEDLMRVLLACRGAWDTADRTGDPVDLHDHALQTAALLRDGRPDDEELQIAGLVHDIGHLLCPGDDADHAEHAARAVRPLLGRRVAHLVRLHVPAKRFLAATHPTRPLSPQSSRTLISQGGPMTAAQARAFAADPLAQDALTLRRADDAGKVVARDAGTMEDWRRVIERVSRTSGDTAG